MFSIASDGMQSSSAASLPSQASSNTDIPDGVVLVILENILNVRMTPSASEEKSNNTLSLEHVRDLLTVWSQEGIPVNVEDVISSSFLEIISHHIDGSLKSWPLASKTPGDDIEGALTEWFLESIERSYVEERNNPRVRIYIIKIIIRFSSVLSNVFLLLYLF